MLLLPVRLAVSLGSLAQPLIAAQGPLVWHAERLASAGRPTPAPSVERLPTPARGEPSERNVCIPCTEEHY